MMIRFSEWRRPVDADYAFQLRSGLSPRVPPPGTRSDIREVARQALAEGEAERFEARVTRWGGPEDEAPDGRRPYESPQLWFVEAPWREVLDRSDLEDVLAGTVQVLRSAEGQTDYVLRDHHTLDVVLYHFATTGELPSALFHADRHSDWCRDSYLAARVPAQAATWWALLPGLKRPSGEPVLREEDVTFTTARAATATGRDVGASTRVPGCVDPADLPWERALERPGATDADWVSLDLDDFQPAAQLALTKGLLRDARFRTMVRAARVRLFVVSPQFTDGGDRVDPWVVRGSRSSSLRLLAWLRRADLAG